MTPSAETHKGPFLLYSSRFKWFKASWGKGFSPKETFNFQRRKYLHVNTTSINHP
jgi:hypothetical protein